MNDIKHHKRIIKIASYIIVIMGIMLMLYPPFTHFYSIFEEAKVHNALANNASLEKNEAEKPKEAEYENKHDEDDAIKATREFQGAILEIPAIDLAAAVLRGTSAEVLEKAPGWYEESALPGEGNTAIAGHRTMYGGWFRNIDRLKSGDKIEVKHEGIVYFYQVEKVFTVKNNDWSVIKPCGYTALTLTTCVKNDSTNRLVVRAVYIEERKEG